MSKRITDYLHLYLGQQAAFYAPNTTDETPNNRIIKELTPLALNDYLTGLSCWGKIKPILRPLVDMTDEEQKHHFDTHPRHWREDLEKYHYTPETILFLFAKGFDVFNLIELELAHDKGKIK